MSVVLAERTTSSGQTLQIAQGDLTLEAVDAIVNAANEHLQHGGGVAWAIVKRGGDMIQEESDAWIRRYGPVPHSRPAWTSAGSLPSRFVIHAVGPIWGDGDEDAKLADAVTGSLRVADELKCASIAFPAISTGIFGYPKDRAAGVIRKAIEDYFVATPESGVKIVKLVLFDQATVDAFLGVWRETGGE
ncbi:MAG: macro domain-containing protein [Chloroflexota bacterium]